MPYRPKNAATADVIARIVKVDADFQGLDRIQIGFETGKQIASNVVSALVDGEISAQDAWTALCTARHVPPFADALLQGFVVALAERAKVTPAIHFSKQEA